MRCADPEQHLRPSRIESTAAAYPGLPDTTVLYSFLCGWHADRLQAAASIHRTDAYIKAQYDDHFVDIIPDAGKMIIHTILACVEYPAVQRANLACRHVKRFAAQRHLRLDVMTLEERCAAAIDALLILVADIIRTGDAYAWITRLRQRFPYAYIKACERDAGQQTFSRSYCLVDAEAPLSVLPASGAEYRP